MGYFFYVMKSAKDGSLYKGMTSNISRRLKEHNSGKNPSTKNKIPYSLVYFEEFVDRLQARLREKYFKSGIGRERLKGMIK